jgi:hypothetical protein
VLDDQQELSKTGFKNMYRTYKATKIIHSVQYSQSEDAMEVLQIAKESKNINTLETFYMFESTEQGQQLNESYRPPNNSIVNK